MSEPAVEVWDYEDLTDEEKAAHDAAMERMRTYSLECFQAKSPRDGLHSGCDDLAAGPGERPCACLCHTMVPSPPPERAEWVACRTPDAARPVTYPLYAPPVTCNLCPDGRLYGDDELLPHLREHHPELVNPDSGPYLSTTCLLNLCAAFDRRCGNVAAARGESGPPSRKYDGAPCVHHCHRSEAADA